MPVNLSRQKLVDALVDTTTVVRNPSNNRISVPRYIKNTGIVNAPVGATNIVVPDADTDDNYTVLVEVSWDTTVWVDNKTNGGFRINFGTAVPSGGRTVRWVKVRNL